MTHQFDKYDRLRHNKLGYFFNKSLQDLYGSPDIIFLTEMNAIAVVRDDKIIVYGYDHSGSNFGRSTIFTVELIEENFSDFTPKDAKSWEDGTDGDLKFSTIEELLKIITRKQARETSHRRQSRLSPAESSRRSVSPTRRSVSPTQRSVVPTQNFEVPNWTTVPRYRMETQNKRDFDIEKQNIEKMVQESGTSIYIISIFSKNDPRFLSQSSENQLSRKVDRAIRLNDPNPDTSFKIFAQYQANGNITIEAWYDRLIRSLNEVHFIQQRKELSCEDKNDVLIASSTNKIKTNYNELEFTIGNDKYLATVEVLNHRHTTPYEEVPIRRRDRFRRS